MKNYGDENLVEGGKVINADIESGTSDPSPSLVGRLFYRTDLNSMRVYNGSTWSSIPSTTSTSAPTNGQIMIGNGTTFVIGTVASGTGISTTVGSGTLQINNTGVTSFLTSLSGLTPSSSTTGAITLAGTLGAASGGTGSTTSPTSGQLAVGTSGGTYTPYTVTTGTGISTTTGSGTFQINNTGITSLTGTANEIAVSASTGAVTLSMPQNVIIPTPASGTALTINGLGTGTQQALQVDGAGSSLIAVFDSTNTNSGYITFTKSGTAEGYLGASAALDAGSATDITLRAQNNLGFATNGANRQFTINTTGAHGFGTSPSYGTSGQVMTSAGSGAVPTWTSASALGSITVTGGTGLGVSGSPVSLGGTVTLSNTGVTSLTGTANQIAASVSTGSVTLSMPNNVIIPTPSSGVALTVTGVSGSSAVTINAGSASSAALNLASGLLQLAGSAGSTGQVLTSQGASTAPIWSTASSSASLTATYVGYGNGSNVLTGTSDFTWTDTTETLALGSQTVAATITNTQYTGSGSAPNLDITAGSSGTSGTHAAWVNITGGSGGTTALGGVVYISGGVTSATGVSGYSGSVYLVGGAGGASGTTPGYALVQGGASPGSSQGGFVQIIGGTSTSGTGGVIEFQTGNASVATVLTINNSGAIGTGSSPSYGTSGQVFTSAGNAAVPTWTAVANSISGTANQITASASTGAVTLSIPTTLTLGTASTGPTINATAGTTTGTTMAITGSQGTSSGSAGGALTITAGSGASASTGGAGGLLTLAGGPATSTGNNAGGGVTISTGVSTGSGAGGTITFKTGTTSSTSYMTIGPAGNVTVNSPASGTALTVTNTIANASGIATVLTSNSTPGNIVENLSTGTAAAVYTTLLNNNSNQLTLLLTGSNYSGSPLSSGGITGLSANLYTQGSCPLVIGTNGTGNIVISTTGNVTVNSPASGNALSVYGVAGAANAVGYFSSAQGTTGGTSDVFVVRSGSTANSAQAGPCIGLGDTVGGTFSSLQQSGGQTELWQYSGAWNQILKVLSTRGVVINTPASGSTLTVNAAPAGYISAVIKGVAGGQALLVQGGSTSSDVCALFQNAAASANFMSIDGAGDVEMYGSLGVGTAASGTTGEIRATNNITAYYSSDARLKTNVKPIANALSKVEQINGVEFDWTDEYINSHGGLHPYFMRKHDVGVIAQEIEAVLPEVVATREDGIKAVKYDRIVALLIEAVKDLSTQNKSLMARVSELENK